jgi:hypothetical protein
MISLFQTAIGGWHWPSVFSLITLLLSFITFIGSGFVTFANLKINRADRIEAARLDRVRGPWILSSEEVKTFEAALADAPKGKVAIEYSAMDQLRVRDFAVKLKDILEGIGYEVWGYIPAFREAGGPATIGIKIGIKVGKSDEVGGFIQSAFSSIEINAPGHHITNNNYPDDYVVIFVGAKPDAAALTLGKR